MAKKKTPKKTNKANKTSKRDPQTLFQRIIKWGFIAAVWCALIMFAIIAWYAKDLAKVTRAVEDSANKVIKIYANDGTTLLETYGNLRGDNVRIEDLPEHIPNAFIAIEDRRFYSHFGIDPIGLVRAMIANTKAGRVVQGGSTITQQLAKNLFFTPERTLERKIQEALLALWLENKYSKEEILSAYLNHVYFGSGAYGIDAAAYIYFNKSAKDLGLNESALLAGLVQAPSRLSPSHNKEGAIKRMKTVLNDMAENGFITPEMMESAASIKIVDGKAQGMEFTERSQSSGYFSDWIYKQARNLTADISDDVNVITTLSPRLQDQIAKIAQQKIDAYKDPKAENPDEHPQVAAVLLNENGAVRAMVGGYDYKKSQFNRAVDGRRQAGSSFKPVVYLAAIEQGWRPNDLISNERITTGRYRPSNYDNQYAPEVTLTEALAKSYNVSAVHLIKEVGVSHVKDLAQRLGMDTEVREELSTALGTVDTSLVDLTSVYGTIAQNGKQINPFGIIKIETENGEIFYEHDDDNTPNVVSYDHAQALKYMMQEVIQSGTGGRAATGFPIAGKTGTTQDYRDALFIGFSSTYTMGVWVGNDNNTPMNRVYGGTIPAEIWRDSMIAAHVGVPARAITNYTPDDDGSFGIKSFINNLFSSSKSDRRYRPQKSTDENNSNNYDFNN